MVVGEIAEPVDLLVVGGGPGGSAAALHAAALGRDVVLVEAHGPEGGLGGACLHVGCIPSKALIELAIARDRAIAQPGLRVAEPRVDLAEFQAWKGGIVARLAGGLDRQLGHAGVRQLRGRLRFTGMGRAVVQTPEDQSRFLEFRQCVVATGSRPAPLPVLPVDGERVITSTGVLALDALPASVVIVGAGYIGLELGTALAKLGAAVTIVEAAKRILPAMDGRVGRPVARALERLGVTVLTGHSVVGSDPAGLVVAGPGGRVTLAAERVVVSVGRVPNTDDLGLQHLGIAPEPDGLLRVDERLLAAPGVAAIGDVTAGPALAHKASAQAVVAVDALCGRPAAFDPMVIPLVVFTDPEVASAGLTEAEARAGGLDVVVGQAPLTANGRAATLDHSDGFARVVLDRAADRVVGVQLVGPHASEMISEAALAIEMVATREDVAGVIHPHPTLSEAVHAAFQATTATRT